MFSTFVLKCRKGGAPKGPHLRDLKCGAGTIVATPSRLNMNVESKPKEERKIYPDFPTIPSVL
jgi:hypothetical protein